MKKMRLGTLTLWLLIKRVIPCTLKYHRMQYHYYNQHLQEGKIVYMTKITIHNAKQGYRPVESPYMIRLNIRTQIAQLQDEPSDFPKYAFSLAPFPNLYQHAGNTEKFLDVIGRILAVSNTARVLTSSGTLKWKRIIHLGDLSGNMIELSLWGPRALEFQGESVYNIGQKNHVIAIFVGTSMKCIKESSYFLSGTSACRWYINENDIPEIKIFQKSLPTIPDQAVKKIDLQSADDIEKHIEQTTCLQLKDIDPFDKLGQRYECTVTITGLAERQS
ncbi:hypothetical protein PVAP13_4KG345276 [Panicum virgatum]|uniref:Replication protein A OB domain-containing protein n=1 Tax=Panicum virgatum TaxID=38727 RepID=A0A8T0TTX2_PANVG|nr:hypothetical protein PVAP13_4KG345276 [Panicum virgatum]KAG2613226.1 hypothetical protein PVAP13_4KG345276 [Panicum virgatum]KAG2613227.1 hypothetical protein PVAP13_4KG345276 [Panicum virgatum]KAG2613228.1 hypothetical protein PVAP13_4KG345276 [Panicum virgatum]KAG2613230.1 hypothetical protein PVAP13_4KG345276 [Panicum virgatum]